MRRALLFGQFIATPNEATRSGFQNDREILSGWLSRK